jgi:hypothetical protein
MSQEEKQRIYFRVTQWDASKQRGEILDRQKVQYDITREHLAPECEGQVAVGDLVSGTSKDFETIVDILIEEGSNPISERKAFDGVGQYSEAKGSWEPRSNPDTGLSGGTPWRQPGDPRFKGAK